MELRSAGMCSWFSFASKRNVAVLSFSETGLDCFISDSEVETVNHSVIQKD